mmetsp:Transcript_34870/g.44012  ORF Transcript_34870/g.44012 Transcript_34870/m.44012 type:complete len:599 (+) Transcript_34870:73-1869(+)
MDVLGNLVGGPGCAPNGASVSQNPLSKLADDMLQGTNSKSRQPLPLGGLSQGHGNIHAHEPNSDAAVQAMNDNFHAARAGNGHLMRPPPPPHEMHGPPMMQQHPNSWAEEFHRHKPQVNHPLHFDEAWGQQTTPPPMMVAHPPPAQWINEFSSRNMAQGIPNPGFENAWQSVSHQPHSIDANQMSNVWNETLVQPSSLEEAWQQGEHVENKKLEGAWSGLDGELVHRDQAVTSHGLEEAWKASDTERTNLEQAWEGSSAELNKRLTEAWEEAKSMQDPELEEIWKESFLSQEGYDQAWAETAAKLEELKDPLSYEFKTNNPFLELDDPFEAGMAFFNDGEIHDAILAFEAEVQRHEDNSEAWLMLGRSQQEHDQDDKAIACLERSVSHDPYNLDALLALGVSYVNELDSEKALMNLKAWVEHNPLYSGLTIKDDEYSDGSVMDGVMQLMMQAAEHNPKDAHVQTVLGVLYNVSKDYDSAVEAFRTCVGLKPDDYSLWNKLGATLANSNNSDKALPAYDRALEIKPKYARGWLNRGISFANLNNNTEAAKCYFKALELNPEARHVWSYLRIIFTCMERFDLVQAASTENLEVFREEFGI